MTGKYPLSPSTRVPHLIDEYEHMTGVAWDRAHKTTLWHKDECHTFERSYVKEVERDNGPNVVKVRIHRRRYGQSPVPQDCTGWDCLVSMSEDDIATHGQATVTNCEKQGAHRVVTIPDTSAPIYVP